MLLEFHWQRRSYGNGGLRAGALERDAVCMQEIASKRSRRAVELVTHHRVPDARQMHADLVRAPGANFHFQKRESSKRFRT